MSTSRTTFSRPGGRLVPSLTTLTLVSGGLLACSEEPPLDADATDELKACLASHGFDEAEAFVSEDHEEIGVGVHEDSPYDEDEVAAAFDECLLSLGLIDELPLRPYEGLTAETYRVPMRDGVELATDVYLPEGEGPFPTVLVRTPYDRQSDGYGYVHHYLEAGIAAVVQDMRGRHASDGVDRVYTTDGDGELKDGYDTFAWLVDQSWCNGRIAAEGESASGIVQYLHTVAQPPGWVGGVAGVASGNLYDSIFRGGVFRESLVVEWLKGQESDYFLEEIYAHPYDDDFWRPVQIKYAYDKSEVPMVHVTGWYDIFVQDGIDTFLAFQGRGASGAKGRQKLIVGPWDHAIGDEEVGEFEIPAGGPPVSLPSVQAALLTDILQLDTPLDLGDPPIAYDDVPAVQYYVMGAHDDTAAPGNEWRTVDSWPPASRPQRFYLDEDGVLSTGCPGGGASHYTFDPADPAPTICGANLAFRSGPCDQSEVEGRDDTLTFTTPPLDDSMEITGGISAQLFVKLDQVDADLMVKLSDVYPDGRSYIITEGATRVAARNGGNVLAPVSVGELVSVPVDLLSTSIIVNKGHRLRVTVSSSNYPRYRVNHNNGAPFGKDAGPMKSVAVSLQHSLEAASFIELSRPEKSAAELVACE